LHGRVDLQAYGNSVSLARNFFAKKYGGLANRAGHRLVLETASPPWLAALHVRLGAELRPDPDRPGMPVSSPRRRDQRRATDAVL
jgi:hypothetical protein